MARHDEINYIASRQPGRPRHEIEAALDNGTINLPSDWATYRTEEE